MPRSGSCNAPAGSRLTGNHHASNPLALALGAVFVSSAHAESLPEYVSETIVVTLTPYCSKISQRRLPPKCIAGA
jgi:hypothetical protein